MKRRSEAEVGAAVVFHLESRGYDVYQEVESHCGIADIVALVGGEDWVIETKATWSLSLLGQCLKRRQVAHRVYAAVPEGTKGWRENARIFEDCGIGVIRVRFAEWYPCGSHVDMPVASDAQLHSPTWPIRALCKPGHKTHAKAGSQTGKRMPRFTEFRATAERLAALVAAEPGILLADAVAKLEHHYANAKSARNHLGQLVARGVIHGVRLDRGNEPRLFPIEVTR